ncbi:hypothetical protein AYO21_07020 [Fonsecaea monophora]|uniref:Uncharacterized protein n=1 Tax=Fonsecaea monophora TaxID=254056 RepID=A0A177F3E5_9EURO|nr:hypothetical protein AYO21_07020 [Fonsecaea monophora]KAH0845920.1 hypothetical protein FOPE_11917 [Fonsecaea pedrosoi]OAG38825.1 hypothetical protein AYO21_07020 [Fonsecaea monophora]
MNSGSRHPAHTQRREKHSFERQRWAVGELPLFEEDLTAWDGNDPQNVQDLINLVQDLRTGSVGGLDDLSTYPILHRRIILEDPSQLVPSTDSGMTAGSLKYVINHLTTGNHAPKNQHQDGFLKWITQICITIWTYRCDQADWRALKRSISESVLSNDFEPAVNDAAYLTIIAFVLGEDLDQMLVEYIDAVVWNSKVEFACEIEPLRSTISRERRSLVEFMYLTFSRVMQELAYCGDKQLLTLGLRLHARLTQLGLDLRRPFAGTQDFNRAQYPAAFEATFLEALMAEQGTLRTRCNAGVVNGAELQHWNPVPRRFGNGEAAVAAFAGLFRRNRQQPAHTHLENILKDAMRAIAERRRKIVDAVQKLKDERDETDGSNATPETDFHAHGGLAHHGANGTAEI